MTNDKFPIKTVRRYDIHDRIFEFIVKVIELIKLLPKTPQNLMIIGQIMRSVSSMGANDQEADGALSRKDFIHCYTIVRKEGNEIIAIISTIIKNSNRSLI